MAAADVIKQFLVSLGYQVDKSSEKKFSNGIAEATKKVGIFVAGVQMMAGTVWASVLRTANSLDNLSDISGRVNVPVDKLEELGYIASQTDSSVETVHASLESLNSVVGQAALGVGRGAMMFKKLGLEAKNADGSVKGTSQVLEDIREKIKDMSKGEQIAFLQRVGIDRTMVQMLTGDVSHLREEFHKMYDSVGVDANEAAQTASDFMDEWGKLGTISSMLYRAINIGFMKKFKDDLTRLRKMIIENADKIKRVITSIVSFVMRVAGAIGAAVMRIIGWIQKLGDWYAKLDDKSKNLIMTLGALIAAWKLLNIQFLATPLGMLIAALTGLFLIVDDLLTYLEGGRSAIDWSKWEDEIKAVTDWFSEFWSSLKTGIQTVGKWIDDFWKKFDSGTVFKDIIAWWNKLDPAAKSLIKILGAVVVAWEALSLAFAVSPIGALILVIGGLLALLGDFFKYLDGKEGTMIDWSKWKKQIDPVINAFTKLKKALAPIFEKYGGTIKKFALAFVGLRIGLQLLSKVFTGLSGGVKLFFSPFSKLFGLFKGSIGTIRNIAGGLGKFSGFLGKFVGMVGGKAISVIGQLGVTLWKFGGILGGKAASGIVKMGVALGEFSAGLVAKVIPAVIKFAAALWANPITWIVAGVLLLIAALYLLYKHWDKVKAAVSDFVKKTVKWFKELPGKIGSAVSSIVETIKGWFKSAKDWAVEKFAPIIEWFKKLPAKIGDKISSIVETIKGWFVSAKDGAIEKFDSLIQWFKDLPGKIGDALAGLIEIISEPFIKAYNYVKGLWNKLWDINDEERGKVEQAQDTMLKKHFESGAPRPSSKELRDNYGVSIEEYNAAQTRYIAAKTKNTAYEPGVALSKMEAELAKINAAAQDVGGHTIVPSPSKQIELTPNVNSNQTNNIKSDNTFNIYTDKPNDAADAVVAKSDAIARNNANAIKPMSNSVYMAERGNR